MISVQDQVQKSLKLVGRVLGDKFKLTACIGIGGSGAVYKADQIALGRTVAVKILNEDLSADARMITRFRGEAMSASRLNHLNCVSIIDYGQAPDGLLYLAMEYVKGPTLTQLLVNEAPLAVERVIDLITQALAGIEEAHLAGVVHADLKADNIIVDQRRAGVDTVKIVDFGIARLVTGRETAEDRAISGTPEYMAPEVIGGAAPSFASDLYAVGIILYELLAAQTPFFAGSTTEILTNHLKVAPKLLTTRREGVPRELDAVISRALAKHPSDRYASAAEMREALLGIRARMRVVPATDKCASCSFQCAPTFKYCPECGTPRGRVSKTFEIPPPSVVLASVLPLPFTGRRAELAQLVAHLGRAPGAPNGLLVLGVDGAGRTRMLHAAYEQVAPTGRVIYQVGPDPSGLASPYYPIRSLLAAILQLPSASNESDLRHAVLGLGLTDRDVPGIAQLFGHPTSLLELEPPVRRREIVWSTLRAIERAGARGPVAIVCEDIDRFDHPSLEILRRATEIEDLVLPPIAMTALPVFGEQWPASAVRLELGSLETADLEKLVATVASSGLALPSVQQLFETTRAFPGHVEHVARYLAEGGKAEDTKVKLPDLVAARLSMVPQATRDALQAAAVLGLEPSRELLRSMAPSATLDAALRDAEARGLLVRDPSGELAFTSRLVREIVYDATPADVRRSLHASAAAAVATMTNDVGLLGHHHDLAGHAPEAIELLARAAQNAVDQLDEVAAGEFFYRALLAVRQAVQQGDIEDGAEQQFVALSVKLADVLRARGETALARGILAEARGWSSAPQLVSMIERASAAIAMSEGDAPGAIAALRRGAGRAIGCGDLTQACELYLDLSSALLRAGDAETANRELVECLDLATLGEGLTAIDGPEPLWRVLRAQATLVDAGGDAPRALRLAEAALYHAQRVRSRLGAARVQQLLAGLCEKAGLTSKADRYRSAAIQEMRNLGDRRATAELLLSDAPTRGARVISKHAQDAMTLTKEIGWTEGTERARRKSTPPPSGRGE